MPVVDFDAWRAEQAAEPVVLKLGGKEYTLPSSLPASVALDLIRLEKEQGEGAMLDRTNIALFAHRLLGPAADEILDSTGFEEMGQLLIQLLGVYAPQAPNRTARRAPARNGSRSSKAGRTSKRTSSGSTS